MQGMISMPRGGFGKGRPLMGNEAMVSKGVHLPPDMWDQLQDQAQKETAIQKDKKGPQVTRADLIRRAVDSFFKEDKPRAREIELKGAIFGGKADMIRPAEDKPMVSIPDGIDVPEKAYLLWLIGDSMQSDYGISIPDGAYAYFKPGASVAPGAIVHVEWEVDGHNVCTLKQYIPQSDGAIFRALNKTTIPREQFRKLDEFRIVGEYRGHWGGKNDNCSQQ